MLSDARRRLDRRLMPIILRRRDCLNTPQVLMSTFSRINNRENQPPRCATRIDTTSTRWGLFSFYSPCTAAMTARWRAGAGQHATDTGPLLLMTASISVAARCVRRGDKPARPILTSCIFAISYSSGLRLFEGDGATPFYRAANFPRITLDVPAPVLTRFSARGYHATIGPMITRHIIATVSRRSIYHQFCHAFALKYTAAHAACVDAAQAIARTLSK